MLGFPIMVEEVVDRVVCGRGKSIEIILEPIIII